MFTALKRWLTADTARATRPDRTRLGVESLELREVLSGSPFSASSYHLDPSGDLRVDAGESQAWIAQGVTQFAQGETARGEHVLYTLGTRGNLNEITAAGTMNFAIEVQSVIQSVNGAGVPSVVFG
jgi:hypothetical protein